MTKEDLKKMSQKVLVMPFSDEEASVLYDFCKEKTVGMDYQRMSFLIMSVLTRTHVPDLCDDVAKYLSDRKQDMGFASEVVVPVLTEFIVLLSVEEEKDKERKAVFSLMLKNALLAVVKGEAKVAFPEGVTKVFDVYHDFLSEEKTYRDEGSSKLLYSVLEDKKGETSFVFKGEEKDQLKAVFYDAVCWRYRKMVENVECEGDTDEKKVFNIVHKLVSLSPWIYTEKSISESLGFLFNKFGITNKMDTLRNMIESLFSEQNENAEQKYARTSLILRMISKDDVGFGLLNSCVQISLKEFSIYLYYELLTEHFLRRINKQ